MGRRSSIASAFASIGKQLTPKAKSSKDGGGGSSRRKSRRHGNYDSDSSSGSDSYSDLSGSELSSSSSYSESSSSRSRGRRKDKDRRRRHHRDDKRSDRRRGRRRRRSSFGSSAGGDIGEDYYINSAKSSSARQFGSSRQRHSSIRHDVAQQMVDLLMRLLPFYGNGDQHSNTVVIDTIHRLPPQALEIPDADGNTCLLVACQVAAYDLLPLLLSKGCNVNARNNVGASSLHFACFADTFSPEAAMELVRHGALVEVAESEFGCTPLHWAAWAGHVELCKILCRAGASPKTMDKNGCDPIAYSKQNAAQTGRTTCTELLESFCEGGANAMCIGGNPGGHSTTENSEWVRLLDGQTGSSFYHNKESGESLWGDDYRNSVHAKSPGDSTGKANSKSEDSANHDEESNDDIPATRTEATYSGTKVAKPANETRESFIGCLDPLGDIVEELSIETSSSNEIVPPTDEGKTESTKDIYSLKDDNLMSIDFDTGDDDETIMPEETPKIQQRSNNRPILRAPDIKSIVDQFSSSSDEEEEKKSLKKSDKKKLTLNESASSNPSPIPSNRYSFEDRISNLHQKMETQLMNRLQNIEQKIAYQKSESLSKSDEDTTELKANLAEMTEATMKLRTDIATKDLEILSLKQKLVRLETDMESQLTKLVPETKATKDVCFGDRDISQVTVDVDADESNPAFDADMATELVELKQRLKETVEALDAAKERCNQTEILLSTAEQKAFDEKASREELMLLLEKARAGQEVGAALTQQFEAEKIQKEEMIALMQKQHSEVELSLKQELQRLREEVDSLESQIQSEKEIAKSLIATHEVATSELKRQHDDDLERMKHELGESHRVQLETVQEVLKEEKISKMEMEVAKNDAVDAMERALEKVQSAEAKLREMTEFVKTTEELRRANEKLHAALLDETEKRKILHNTIEDMKGRIRVYVRVRPLSSKEVEAKFANIMVKEDERTCVMKGDEGSGAETRDWEFDKIFYGSDVDGNTQEAVFKDASDLITSAIDGFNVCIFAYGQTGSGKTYTMFGSDDPTNDKQMGLAPRVAQELFEKLQERESSNHIEVTVTMMELYNDKLVDLLVPKKNASEEYCELKIRLAEHTNSGLVEVEGAKSERATNTSELLEIFGRGSRGRTSSSTKMNAESSRSHMVTSVVISLRNHRTGKIVRGKCTLVDLAGSERVSKSGAAGHQLKEAQSINKSLSALGDVIGALTTGGRQHIPYRNHPLTMLMSDSIGGNAKTLMFLCCSPAEYNRKETTNSLDFAKRCRNVTNNVVKGATSASHVNQVRALKKELSKIPKDQRKPRRATVIRRPGM